MNLWKRLKNLWQLSGYKMSAKTIMPDTKETIQFLAKDFPTINKQLAKIIPNEEKTIYEILES